MAAQLSDIADIRQRARHHVESGAVTRENRADRERVIELLNQVLATELVCILRYKSHYHLARGIESDALRAEFAQHAREAEQHADLVAERIVQLNGAPNFNPEGLAERSRSEFRLGSGLNELIKEDLVAERVAIESYSEIVRWLGDDDITTRIVMEQILKVEEEHAEDMKRLFDRISASRSSLP
jgi:bacterioferritin